MALTPHKHIRGLFVALLSLCALSGGAAYAATQRTVGNPIGTGVVVIETNLAYQDAAAAGTGMVLTPTGEILTNNHVIKGATTIKVLVPNTSRSYAARVMGYDIRHDVAVLQLSKASNLKTVTTAKALSVGAAVTAVGNAGGTGVLTTVQGTITGLAKSVTVQDDNGGTERLAGLIETNAPIQAGDSGGPLLNAAGRVVGMNTAGSVGYGVMNTAATDAYAVPITTALKVVKQAESVTSTAAVHVGPTAFLGVSVLSSSSYPSVDAPAGATVADILQGGPAEAAGLAVGDVITSMDGTTISSQGDLQAFMLAHKPGDKVSVAYTDGYGQSQTTNLTLASGPAQ